MTLDPMALLTIGCALGFVAGALMVYLLGLVTKRERTEADDLAARRNVHHFPARVAFPYVCRDAEDAARVLIDCEAGSPTTIYAVERTMREDPEGLIMLEPRLAPVKR